MAEPKNADLELLIKMMGQTTNENDNIALVALRKANTQVLKLAGSWEKLLREKFTIAADPFGGFEVPDFGETKAAAPRMDRPAPRHYTPPPPQPAPQSARPASPPPSWPRPKPATPPDPMNAGAAGPMGNPASQNAAHGKGRPNIFPGTCPDCLHTVNPNEGYLDGQNPHTGSWIIRHSDKYVCNQLKSQSASKRRKAGTASNQDILDSLLGS